MQNYSSPFSALQDFQKAIEQAMGEEFFGINTTSRGQFPGVNLFKNEEEIIALLELPGLEKDQIHIEFQDNILRIAGERKVPVDLNEVSIHRNERKFGRFDRAIRISNQINSNEIKAEYQNGVLMIHLPLQESARPRQINIQ